MSMKPTARDDFAEKVIKTAGGGCFTAVIDDHHYYDENLDIKKFESGHLYFPSVLINALGVYKDISGESLFYQDEPGEPKFIHYKNMSYVLSKISDENVMIDEPIRCIATYESYVDLPNWMGVDKLKCALENTKRKKEQTLEKLVHEAEYRSVKTMFRETVETAIVLLLQYISITPTMLHLNIVAILLYFIISGLILTRFIGRSTKLYVQYKNMERIYKEHFKKK